MSASNQIKKFYLKSVHFITVQHKLSRAFQTDIVMSYRSSLNFVPIEWFWAKWPGPRMTNYGLRSASSSLLKFTRFIQGNTIAWTNLDMIRNLQHLHMNKKSYTYKTLPLIIVIEFFSELKVSCGPSNNNHCKVKFDGRDRVLTRDLHLPMTITTRELS
jgi:hypothetical protein